MGRATFDLLAEAGLGGVINRLTLLIVTCPLRGSMGGVCVMGRPHRCKGNERKRILGGGYSFAARLVLEGGGVGERVITRPTLSSITGLLQTSRREWFGAGSPSQNAGVYGG